ncbi:hypothetical protein LINPERPRIM_LOCUS146 [Linum perenne]
MDFNTQSAVRGKFARIPVEIDLSEPLGTGIELDGAWQRVEHENLAELYSLRTNRRFFGLTGGGRIWPLANSDAEGWAAQTGGQF